MYVALYIISFLDKVSSLMCGLGFLCGSHAGVSERIAGLRQLCRSLFERMLPLAGPAFDLTKINVGVTKFALIGGTNKRKLVRMVALVEEGDMG